MASRKKMIKLLLVMVCVIFCAAGQAGAVEWYVDDDGPGDPGTGGKGFLTNKVAISACNHCLALDPNGHVWAWGNNDNGQLGVGGDTQRCYPVKSDSDGYKYMVEKCLRVLLIDTD